MKSQMRRSEVLAVLAGLVVASILKRGCGEASEPARRSARVQRNPLYPDIDLWGTESYLWNEEQLDWLGVIRLDDIGSPKPPRVITTLYTTGWGASADRSFIRAHNGSWSYENRRVRIEYGLRGRSVEMLVLLKAPGQEDDHFGKYVTPEERTVGIRLIGTLTQSADVDARFVHLEGSRFRGVIHEHGSPPFIVVYPKENYWVDLMLEYRASSPYQLQRW